MLSERFCAAPDQLRVFGREGDGSPAGLWLQPAGRDGGVPVLDGLAGGHRGGAGQHPHRTGRRRGDQEGRKLSSSRGGRPSRHAASRTCCVWRGWAW